MAKKLLKIEKEAKQWLKKQLTLEQFVFKKSDVQKSTYLYLEQNSLVAELNNQYIFIKSDLELTVNAFNNNIWLLVFQYLNLAFDQNWYITGHYSYQFAMENFSLREKQITISTKKKSNSIIELPAAIKVVASYDKDFDNKPLLNRNFFSVKYKELKAEYLVIKSTKNEYQSYQDEIIAILKSSERDEDFIMQYFENNSQPVLLARLIGALRAIDDFSLKFELEKQLKLSQVKISIRNPFNKVSLTESRERPAFLNRFELSMQKAIETLNKIKKPRRLSKKLNTKDLENLVINDTYHSLTIEGYTVTKALIAYLINDSKTNESFPQDLRNQLSAKGFMNALSYIKELNKSKYHINEQISSKLFQELWKPSIHAGLIKGELDSYRKHMVAIKGAQYVPPGHEKVPYMLDELFDYLIKIKNGFALGIFLHFFYVGIHPHGDGNGRISRFLMNLAFIQDKYKWLTIDSADKDNYFAALEKSQLEDDISHFANYILSQYRSS